MVAEVWSVTEDHLMSTGMSRLWSWGYIKPETYQRAVGYPSPCNVTLNNSATTFGRVGRQMCGRAVKRATAGCTAAASLTASAWSGTSRPAAAVWGGPVRWPRAAQRQTVNTPQHRWEEGSPGPTAGFLRADLRLPCVALRV